MTPRRDSPDEWEQVPKLLAMLSSGSVSLRIDGDPVISVNADLKDVDVQVAALRDRMGVGDMLSIASGGGTGMFRATKVPAVLAREEWRVCLKDGDRSLVDVGRGTSALTGHVRVHVGANLNELRDQVRRLF